ncbi:SNF2 family N-terminal domain-containing protein [Gorgonomyces haynaldii]|nr:SNF2 family N-terminal domain-containing protein [Gorgonomyces haynaldii]
MQTLIRTGLSIDSCVCLKQAPDRLLSRKSWKIYMVRNDAPVGKFIGIEAWVLHHLMSMSDFELECKILYVPEKMRIGDQVLVGVQIYWKPNSQQSLDLLETQLKERKIVLSRMFEKTGLMHEAEVDRLEATEELPEGYEVSADQLNLIYKSANMVQKDLAPLDALPGFQLELKHYQKSALGFMVSKESGTLESIALSPLWREFGLGKTIEMLSLVHYQYLTQDFLVVCPLNLLSHWKEEIDKCMDCNVSIFYGGNRTLYKQQGLAIVITTYQTLASEYEKLNSPLYSINWERIILDEAHLIRERSTKAAVACYHLNGKNRWAVTGTPIVNKLDDFFSLIHFLKVDPWGQHSFWSSFVSLPFSKRDTSALSVVQTIMEPLILRRTKDAKDVDGNPIVSLPPKQIVTEFLEFDKKERELYDSINDYSRKQLDTSKMDYVHIFQLLVRLRQMCDHPLLVKAKTTTKGEQREIVELQTLLKEYQKTSYTKDLETRLEQASETECPVCLELCTEAAVLPCLHIICDYCVTSIEDFNNQKDSSDLLECPLCRDKFDPSNVKKVVSERHKIDSVHQSTKIKRLLDHMDSIHKTDTKTVIFSQWAEMLDLVESALRAKDYPFVRLDGSMTQIQRDKSLKLFRDKNGPKILIATLRSTNVGLNLVVASNVFLAIDRVHRLGQTRDVIVRRFIIKDSVEEKMLKIQERKERLVGALTGDQDKVGMQDLLQLFD